MNKIKNQKLHPYLILDRDGTIIVDRIYLSEPSQIEYLPGIFDALKDLRDKGFKFLVATNQSGIAIGKLTEEQLHAVHKKMADDLAKHNLTIEHYYYAPYSVESNHPMRKPNTGMLDLAKKEWPMDVSKSYMIGDRFTDVIAGARAGLKTVFLGNDTDIETDMQTYKIRPSYVAKDLRSFSKQDAF
jgi:D-glycero-D-manno-heptose 1,7-bisphosphate phosphatase